MNSDHDENAFNNLTSVFVPKIITSTYLYHDFDFATEVIDTLVDEDKGCPWDKVQRMKRLSVIYLKKHLNCSKLLTMKMIGI